MVTEKKTKAKKKIVNGLAFLAVSFFLLGTGIVVLQNWDYNKAPYEATYENMESQPQEIDENAVSAQFWLKRVETFEEDDNIILSKNTIAIRNYENRRMISVRNNSFSLQDIGEQFNGAVLKRLLSDTRMIPANPEEYLLDGVPTTKSYWISLKKKENKNAIGSVVQVKYGFSVCRSEMKRFPTKDKVYKKDSNLYYDEMLQSDLLPYMPVVVLHESKNGKFYYVLTYGYGGWVPSNAIAFCESKDEWMEWQSPSNYLVVTGASIRVNSDPYQSDASNLILPMGTKLEILSQEEKPKSVHNRMTVGNYVARVPGKDAEGRLVEELILIPYTEDVSVGYLSFTEKNVICQSMKMVGQVYGWAGDHNSVDCSAMTRQIYACFGATLPRSAKAQSSMKGYKCVKMGSKSTKRRISDIKKMPVGTLFYFPGHVMLYLGMVTGNLTVSVLWEVSRKRMGIRWWFGR